MHKTIQEELVFLAVGIRGRWSVKTKKYFMKYPCYSIIEHCYVSIIDAS